MFAEYILQAYENGTKKANILQIDRKGFQSPFANYLQNVCFFRSIFIRLQNIFCNYVRNISCKENCNQFANRENIFRKGSIFVWESFGLGVGLFTKSRNNTLYQSRENWLLGEKLIAWGKILFFGKICRGEDADYQRHFLRKQEGQDGPGSLT